MNWWQEQDDVTVIEPILAKKDCKLRIDAVESATWTVKAADKGGAPGYEGQAFKAAKMTLTIIDEAIHTEHENARPKLTFEFQFNMDKYPCVSKRTGEVEMMSRRHLYGLEEAFGFAPVFVDAQGQPVAPYVTRSGRKVAPKGDGVKQTLNPDFVAAYFTADGHPNLEWAGKIVYADVDVEKNEQYGDKNTIKRFKVPPVTV